MATDTLMTPTLAAIRFGTGLPASPVMRSPADMLAALAGPDVAAAVWPGLGLAQILPVYRTARTARQAARRGDVEKVAYKLKLRDAKDQADQVNKTTFARAVGADDGFRERLVQFWADHFTTEPRFLIDAALPAALIEDAVRPHVAGRFADMLRAVTLQPAMLLYLDQVNSTGPNSPVGSRKGAGLNENLAREVLELHTLGVGGAYGQADVRGAAEVLTGATMTPEDGFVFDEGRAEPGASTVLGRVYDGTGVARIHALLEDLAVHPDTGRHLARKLAVHFVSDAPDEGMVADMAAAYAASGVLLDVYAAMLHHPAAWEPVAQKARQPFDFIVAALRALAVPPDRIAGMGRGEFRKRVILPLRAMGQEWGRPGGPDGWEEDAEAWINAEGLAARISWAMEAPGKFGPLPDPRVLVKTALGDQAGERLIWATSAAESPREGVGLILASAEFNRR
jgi:uncharacterized protein (DUF1800 family)